MRLGVLTVVNGNITIFYDVTPCSQVDIYQSFGGTFPEDESSSSSEKFINIYQTMWHHILKDGKLHLTQSVTDAHMTDTVIIPTFKTM